MSLFKVFIKSFGKDDKDSIVKAKSNGTIYIDDVRQIKGLGKTLEKLREIYPEQPASK